MITLAKVKESVETNGRKIIKVIQYGVKTAKQSSPYGIDSTPIANLTAIYSDTNNDGEAVIIGYINTDHITKAGEVRLFSSGGSYAYCKDDGTMELNGNEYSAVRFQKMNLELTKQVALLNAELSKIAAAGSSIGMAYVPAPLQLDLTQAESPTIKIK